MPKPSNYETSTIQTEHMGQAVDEMMKAAEGTRRGFERKWYDNNFFFDGYHFRYVSRTQNKIIDLTKESELYHGIRAIPKASRQLEGIVNLLVSNDYVAKIYPERVDKTQFPSVPQQDPQTGQMVEAENPQYKEAVEKAKEQAKRVGYWLEEEMGDQNQDLKTKIAFAGLLAGKHSISYIQVWPDAIHEKIKTRVRDAFDVYLLGDMNEIEDCPFVIIGKPRNIAEIKADDRFDKEQRDSINPDNRQASSEIKAAYMSVRYGKEFSDDRSATVIQKEAYVKEYLNNENFKKIKKQKNGQQILEDRDYGDIVYRQVFSAGNIWLRDEYIDLRSYPLVDVRFQYGPLYQTSPIERFIPSNKSMDVIVSRIERYANAFPLGVIAKRQGEQYNISNIPGGQQVEYKSVPPIFQNIGNLPPFLFNYLGLLDNFISEQGVTTSTMGNLPKGVKGWQAIESLKESEYANLVMPDRMMKRTIRMVAEKFIELADQYFVTPQSVYHEEKGEPEYFDVIGATALDKRKELKVEPEEDVIPITRKYNVKIEVQKGMAYTREGQKEYARQLGEYLIQLVQLGIVPPQAVTLFIENLLEAFEYGPAGDFMEAMNEYQDEGMLSEDQMNKIKIAVVEVLKDAGVVGPEADEKLIDSTKIGVVEALRDTGLINKDNSGGLEEEKVREEMELKREKHEVEIVRGEDKAQIEKAKAIQDMTLKERQAMESSQMKKEMAKHQMKMSEKMANKPKKGGGEDA